MSPAGDSWQHADGDGRAGIVFANGDGKESNPLTANFRARAGTRIEGDHLQEIVAAEFFAGIPCAGLAFSAGAQGFVDEVITEDRGVSGAGAGDGFPEHGLGGPAIGFAEGVVPFGNVFGAVTGETGEVEIEAGGFGESEEI